MAGKRKICRYSHARGSALLMLAALTAVILSSGAAEAKANRSLLFVIDSSENMAPYMSSVKGTMLTYVDQSNPGDYFGIITFGTTAKLLTIKKISSQSDRRSLGFMLEAVAPEGEKADIDRGIERALEELVTLKRRGDTNVKGIIVISSSKSSDESRSHEILEKAVEEVSEYLNEDEWYIQYCYLNGADDNLVEKFVSDNGGFSYDIDKLGSENGIETMAELYQVTSMPQEQCRVRLADLKGPVLGKRPTADQWMSLRAGDAVSEDTQLSVADESRAVIALGDYGRLGLSPGTGITLLSARRDPWTGQALMRIVLEAGFVWCHLSGPESTLRLESSGNAIVLAGKANTVVYSGESDAIQVVSFSGSIPISAIGSDEKPVLLGPNQSTRLNPGLLFSQPEPAEARFVEEWKTWSKALIGNARISAIEFIVPEVLFPRESITLGPISSGDTLSQTFPLQIKGVNDLSKLKLLVDISLRLPKGLSLSTAIADGEEQGTKALFIKLDGSEGFRSGRSDAHNGFLRISAAPDSGVVFERIAVPITITTERSLLSSPALILGLVVILLGASAFTAVFMLRAKESMRAKPHRVIGRLIVINDPTRGRTGSINLEEISTKSSRLSLVIGRDKTSEIRLKHPSVKPDHCVIEANLVAQRLVSYIEPIGPAVVLVDGEDIHSKTLLSDGAKIAIGDFTFQFEDTQLYKRVEIVYSSGRRISGILDVLGMDAEGFKISPMDAVSASERARVRFAEIRYVIFYRRAADILAKKPRPAVKPGTMKRVELMFKKGNTISGYVQREYSEGRHRYIELLPLDPNSAVDYTIVEYSAIVEKKNL